MTANPLSSELLASLAARLSNLPDTPRLKFGVWPSGGWVLTSTREITALFCDIWNNRHGLAASLRAIAAQQPNTTGGEG